MKIKLPYKNEIIIIVLIIFFSFVVKTIISSYSRKIQELTMQEGELKGKEKFLKDWESVNRDFQKIKNNFFFQNSHSFKKFVEAKAEKRNININYLRPSQREDELHREIEIFLRFFSSYEDLVVFIESLEDKNIEVGKLEISGNRKARAIVVTLKGIIPKEK